MKFAILGLGLFLTMLLIAGVSAEAEKTEAFVCPVLNENVGMHNPNAVPISDGDYTVLPGARGGHESSIMVPEHATNGDGSGSPGGPHSSPGDTDYTAIWAG